MEQQDMSKQAAEAEAVLRSPDSLPRFKEYLERQGSFCQGSRTPSRYAFILGFFQRQDKDLLLFLSGNGQHTNPIYRGALKKALACFGFSELARQLKGHKTPSKRQAPTTTRQEREAIIDNLPLKFKLMAKIQHDTGCRAAEVVSLERDDIGAGEDGRNTIQVKTKGGKKMIYYLSRDTSAFLLAWLQHTGAEESLFRDASITLHSNYCKYWDAVRKAAAPVLKGKISEKFYPHAFRYGLAFDMFKDGANILDVKEALGHADISTTTIYLQGSARQSLENIKKLRERVER